MISRPLKETAFGHQRGGRRIQVHHSRFNDRWLMELGIEPRRILDLGSYDAGDALRFQTAFPHCRVVTIEADPARFEVVEENVRGSLIEARNLAILDRDGPVDWYPAVDGRVGEVGAQGSLYRQSEGLDSAFPFVRQDERPSTVAGRRLDSLCSELGIADIDLLHVDIQGAEHAALVGLGNLRPKVIFVEWQKDGRGWIGGAPATATAALFAQMGYELAADIRSDRLYVKSELVRWRGALGTLRRWVANLRRHHVPAEGRKL